MAKRREIKLEAGNRLDLRDAADANQTALAILKAAFEQRLAQGDGRAATLDSVVEIATEAGYKGTVDQARSILKVDGGFIVEPVSNGRLIVRRSTGP